MWVVTGSTHYHFKLSVLQQQGFFLVLSSGSLFEREWNSLCSRGLCECSHVCSGICEKQTWQMTTKWWIRGSTESDRYGSWIQFYNTDINWTFMHRICQMDSKLHIELSEMPFLLWCAVYLMMLTKCGFCFQFNFIWIKDLAMYNNILLSKNSILIS